MKNIRKFLKDIQNNQYGNWDLNSNTDGFKYISIYRRWTGECIFSDDNGNSGLGEDFNEFSSEEKTVIENAFRSIISKSYKHQHIDNKIIIREINLQLMPV
jgi:ABC-type transporter MlaC component